MKKTTMLSASALVLTFASAVALTVEPVRETVVEAIQGQPVNQIERISERPVRLPEAGYYSVPFTFAPTAEQFGECLLVADADGKTFTYDSTEKAIKADYNFSNATDKYCYLPGVMLEAGVYTISFQHKTRSDDENYAITMGKAQTPEAQTIEFLRKESYKNDSYSTELFTFEIEEDATYYLAFHHYSGKNKYNVYLRNISIVAVDNSVPRTPEIQSLEFVGTEGKMVVKMPETQFDGVALPDELTLHILCDGNEIKTETSAPGEIVESQITATLGEHVFGAFVSAEINGKIKNSETVTQSLRVVKIIDVPMQVPFLMPCDEDDFAYCTVYNVNEDNNTWAWANTGNSGNRDSFRYTYNYSKDADDWIVLPAVEFTEAGAYKFSFDITTKYDEESVEVLMADEPTLDALSAGQKLLDLKNLKTSDVWVNKDGSFAVAAPGVKYIAVHCYSLKNKSYVYISNIAVTSTDPRGISNPTFGDIEFDGSEGSISVVLPATNIIGEPLDATEVSATLTVDGEKYGETLTGIPGQTVTWPATLERGEHDLATQAFYTIDGDTFNSEIIKSNVKITRPSSFHYDMPLELSMKGADFIEDVAVFDVNSDLKTWTGDNNGLKYTYSAGYSADDWAILLPVMIEDASKTLSFSVRATAYSSSYEEKFSAWIGDSRTVAGMTIQILPETTVTATGSGEIYTATFNVPSPGLYYVGFHCTSAANKYYLYLSDLKLEYEGAAALLPAPLSDLAAVADQQGENAVDVSFTFPSETAGGTALDTETELTATVVSEVETKTVYGLPGSAAVVRVNAKPGENTISVTVTGEAGSTSPQSVSLYCGLDTPKTPAFKSASMTEDGHGVELTWDAVTEGIHGGVINAEKLTYRITPYDEDDEDWDYTESIYTQDLNCTFSVANGTPQGFVTLGIEAYQSASTNSGIGYLEVCVGKPIDDDIEEEFANGEVTFGPIYTFSNTSSRPSWTVAQADSYVPEAALENEHMLIGTATTNGSDSGVMLPLVATSDTEKEYKLKFDIYVSDVTPYMAAILGAYGEDRIILGEIAADGETGWKTFTYTLPESYVGRAWVQPGIYARFDDASNQYALVNKWSLTRNISDGVDDVALAVTSVRGLRGSILIAGAEGAEVTVCNLAGIVEYAGKVTSTFYDISMPAGIYIVNLAGQPYKVVVK